VRLSSLTRFVPGVLLGGALLLGPGCASTASPDDPAGARCDERESARAGDVGDCTLKTAAEACPDCIEALGAAFSDGSHEPFPTNDDPSNQIRFGTAEQADPRRAELVDFIWKDGLPTTAPVVTTDVTLPPTVGIEAKMAARVDRIDVDVSGWDFHAVSYVLRPVNPSNANRVVIIHQGHGADLRFGVGATADHLLEGGFTVAVMMMPLSGWNRDATAVIPDRGALTFANHDAMIEEAAENEDGQGFRLFLEPVVQSINYFVESNPELEDVTMIGLSGGGWTTSMMAAVDDRITFSVPIADSAPLYHRNADRRSVGDLEQHYVPLYDEDIQPDGNGGGVATWLEIYALGGHGPDRRQIQVTNRFDPCCFSGTFADSYKEIVAAKVTELGEGAWEHVLDSSHTRHAISEHVITQVIDPLLASARDPSPSDAWAPDALPWAPAPAERSTWLGGPPAADRFALDLVVD
jgi:hypothetical protein